MAYRRLPNTDNSRLKAINKLAELLLEENFEFLSSYKDEVVKNQIVFTKLIDNRKQSVLKRSLLNEEKRIQLVRLKLYVSHFFQVLNFAIDRGDILKESRQFFDLEINTGIIPPLSKEIDVLKWADNITKGEKRRIDNGEKMISHPSFLKIEDVKNIAYLSINELQKLEECLEFCQSEIKEQRIKIDEFIKDIWNKIEFQFVNETIEIKRKKSAHFGVVYVK